jgi:hypothetical protein
MSLYLKEVQRGIMDQMDRVVEDEDQALQVFCSTCDLGI